MSEEQAIKADKRKRRRRRVGYSLWGMAKLAVLLSAVGLIIFAMSGKPFNAPEWMRTRIQNQLNSVVTNGDVQFQAIDLRFDKGIKPTVTVRDLVLTNDNDVVVARVESASASLSPKALIKGEVHPTDVRLHQATVNLRRTRNGEFDLGFGVEMGDGVSSTETLPELLDKIDNAFATPVLAAIETVELSQLSLNFADARARRGWLISDGRMQLTQDAETVEISVGFELDHGADQTASAALTFETQKGSSGAKFGAKVDQIAARDLASQIPALAWLGVLDAPISGALRAEIDESGSLGKMNGTLEIGEGSLRPTEDARAIAFNQGRAYFGYDPSEKKITFDELSVETEAGKVVAEGQAYLREITGGVPAVLLGQLRILEAVVNPKGVFADQLVISGGAVDLRLRLNPFIITIGQAVVVDGEHNYLVRGEIKADATGWHVAMDAKADEINPQRMIEFWPVAAIPGTRDWIEDNVNSASIFNVNGAVRIDTDVTPNFELGFEFADANVRFMKALPPVLGGSGHASIANDAFTVVVDRGKVTAPEGGVLDASGTVFRIPDVNVKGPPAIINLKVNGPIHAAMSILDEPPFKILSKAGQPVDLADGHAQITGEIRLRLVKDILIEDVDYQISAALLNVRSEKLIDGRILRADRLALTADLNDIVISGAGFLGRVPVQGTWRQQQAAEFKGQSQLEGTVELSQKFVTEFGIGLPQGSVTGAGVGQIEIDLRRGQASKFRLISDLNRIGLRLSDLGWSLPKNSTGRLEVVGSLGTPTRIDKLIIEGAGLKTAGTVTLTEDGGFKVARFSRVRLAGWLDAPIELIGRGRGATPSVKVLGGMIDTRKTTFGSGSGANSGAGGKLTVSLDRLVVSDGISLTGFRGNFTRRAGFNGSFTARVNGKARIKGTVVPSKGGSSFRIQSSDAGAVFRAAGVMETVHGGSMDLTLIPRQGAKGQYDGRIKGKGIRIKGAPAMADLLGAISGVGLLEQLNGRGIVFGDYQVRFRLTPRQVIITSGSAVGASMGVSMDGVYNLASSTLDVQGVLSPIYFLNGIGQIFTRKGEGLFGFNYRMTGKANDPKVRVNPFSILTPGMFRELFKRPPPRVER